MRTTVQLRDDQRERLAAIAAKRGLRGYSALIQEAVDQYLIDERSRDRRIAAALALEGSMTKEEAEEGRRRIREAWSMWRTP